MLRMMDGLKIENCLQGVYFNNVVDKLHCLFLEYLFYFPLYDMNQEIEYIHETTQ